MTDEEREQAQAAIEQRKRQIANDEAARDALSTKSLLEQVAEAAEQATGMTREQLLAMQVEHLGDAVTQLRAPREAVLARGVPELHVRHVYDKAPMPCDALEYVEGFLLSATTLLVLSGGVGTRKTGSACWALTQKPGRYVTADDLGRLAAARDEEGQVEYRRTKKAQLLVIDDLGGEFLDDKGWFFRVFNGLIDLRYSQCLKTIITTNLDPKQFSANYGQRVADRIREQGDFVEVGGESVRALTRGRR